MKCDLCQTEIYKDEEGFFTNVRLLCKGCANKPRYRYYYTLRPPGIGCQPDGFVDRASFGRQGQRTKLIGGRDWTVYGWVEYHKPLGPEELFKWDLWPHNAGEVAGYLDWKERARR